MSPIVIIIILVVLLAVIGVGILCTWSFWKRWLNRCLSDGSAPEAVWQAPPTGQPTFDQLDPSRLSQVRRSRDGVVNIEQLPTLGDLNIDPRESFELRQTRFPQGIISISGDFYEHDWFHAPYQSFPLQNLEYIKVIGKGWFGQAIEAEATDIVPHVRTKKVIVKKLRDDATDDEKTRFLNQCRIFRDCDSNHILKLLGFVVDAPPFLAILEYWPLGDLKSYLIGKQKAGEGSSMCQQGVIDRMAIDIAKGLQWIHSKGFIHEDLAARNCLVTNAAGKVILGDYGLGPKQFPRDYYKISNMAVPIRWTSPESYEFRDGTCSPLPVTPAANIWSFGVLLMELYDFGKQPYSTMKDEDVIKKVLVSKSYLMEPPSFPYMNSTTSSKLYRLMMSCWNSVPEGRTSLQEIIEGLTTPGTPYSS